MTLTLQKNRRDRVLISKNKEPTITVHINGECTNLSNSLDNLNEKADKLIDKLEYINKLTNKQEV